MAVRLAVDGRVVHDDDLVVLRHADVELEHVGAGAQRVPEREHRVRRELVLAALMGDVQRAVLLDPRVGRLRGGDGQDRGGGGDGQGQESAAHAEQTSLRRMADIAEQLERRRAAAADAWDVGDAVVLVEAGDGDPGARPRRPHYPFHAHSEYLYLTDRERPGGVLAFDPGEGWVEFVRAGHGRGAPLDGARGRPRGRAGGHAAASTSWRTG